MAWYEHLSGNKYKLVARDPSSIRRKRITKTVEVPPEIARSERKTKQWLDRELAKFAEAVEEGTHTRPEKMTFEQFVERWEKGYAQENLGGYTRYNTMNAIKAYLIPEFGQARMDQIKPLHLVEFFANLKRQDGQPMSTNTKLNIFKAAKSIFDAAYAWKVIPSNPMDGVKRPSQSKQEKKQIRSKKKAYTVAEVVALLEAMQTLPDHWRLYFTGVMIGGFRKGEFLAIEWSDVDYERRAIWIDKQITLDAEGRKTEGYVKTESSEGYVAMPQWYMDELKKYELEWKKEKLRCKEWRGGNKQYVFHGGDGVMYYPTTPTGVWRRFLRKHGLPHVPVHGLRHTCGKLLQEFGMDLKAIQERLRHSKLGTTADIYLQKGDIIDYRAADQLELLNPKFLKFAPYSAPRG